jgi:uncharacterized membrane protein YedE/YeeE
MKNRWPLLVAFAAGTVFALGLGLSGMTRPGKVVAFLDVAGAWDVTLAFVMAGAIAVHIGFALRAKRASAPLLGPRFVLPARDAVDASLLVGASLFGVGWGLQGYCPGPAIVASASGSAVPIVFVASMIAGLLAPRLFAFRDSSNQMQRGAETGSTRPRHDSPTAG